MGDIGVHHITCSPQYHQINGLAENMYRLGKKLAVQSQEVILP